MNSTEPGELIIRLGHNPKFLNRLPLKPPNPPASPPTMAVTSTNSIELGNEKIAATRSDKMVSMLMTLNARMTFKVTISLIIGRHKDAEIIHHLLSI
jgi:hypothetical protein